MIPTSASKTRSAVMGAAAVLVLCGAGALFGLQACGDSSPGSKTPDPSGSGSATSNPTPPPTPPTPPTDVPPT